jgi:hypothetical protein
MEPPPLNTVEGAYWYLMAVLLGVVALLVLYVIGAMVGLVPDPTTLF